MIRGPLRIVFAAIADKFRILQIGDGADQILDFALFDFLWRGRRLRKGGCQQKTNEKKYTKQLVQGKYSRSAKESRTHHSKPSIGSSDITSVSRRRAAETPGSLAELMSFPFSRHSQVICALTDSGAFCSTT